jgi:hypothetical protein
LSPSNARFRSRTITSLIYELLQVSEAGPHLDYPDWLLPSQAQVDCATKAHQVDTALWFDSSDQLPALVATGQSTMCFNLLEFIGRRLEQTPDHAGLTAQRNRLLGLWEQLKADPYKLLRQSDSSGLLEPGLDAGSQAVRPARSAG